MRRWILLGALALVTAACSAGSSDTQTSDPTTTVSASTTVASSTPEASTTTIEAEVTTTAAVAVGGHPLVIASVDFEGGVIVIRNDGDEPYDLTGHYLCNRPNYSQVPAETIASGGTIEVSAASLGVTSGNGELGVYTSNSFGSADAIVRYVQWGSDSHGRTSVAVSAGVWAAGDWVDNGGVAIQSSGNDPVSAADWSSG